MYEALRLSIDSSSFSSIISMKIERESSLFTKECRPLIFYDINEIVEEFRSISRFMIFY